jgi:hypothetical protein
MKSKPFVITYVMIILISTICIINAKGKPEYLSSENDSTITFSNSKEALEKFRSNSNPNIRIVTLQKEGRRKQVNRSSSPEDADNLKMLLISGLEDRYPNVAIEAVETIGILNDKTMETDVISVYENAQKKYYGYFERVQIAAIETLGKIGGEETSRLFKQLLLTEENSYLLNSILNSIQTLNDKSMIYDVQAFQYKMERFGVERQGSESSLYLSIAEHAKTVLASLNGKKGN